MKVSKEINELVNAYCRLRDRQHAVYSQCAKRHDLTTNNCSYSIFFGLRPKDARRRRSVSGSLPTSRRSQQS